MNLKGILIVVIIIGALFANVAQAEIWVKGIYISQATVQSTSYFKRLISQAKAVGINTFVVDYSYNSSIYRKNIAFLKQNNIRYIARIVVFPYGGTTTQVRSEVYWQKKYRLAEKAIVLGASEIQLDYIRYRAMRIASVQNVKDIYQVIRWFKQKLKAKNIPLQIDIFGEVSFGPSLNIGQDVKVFADSVDAVCPMVYPSHYEPFLKYAKIPYFTVLSSLQALHAQFGGYAPFRVYPFIELYNYRYPLSRTQKLEYIYEQIRGVEDGNVDGWYAWSPRNKYYNLFCVLKTYKVK
jgi:hypothetical protein